MVQDCRFTPHGRRGICTGSSGIGHTECFAVEVFFPFGICQGSDGFHASVIASHVGFDEFVSGEGGFVFALLLFGDAGWRWYGGIEG